MSVLCKKKANEWTMQTVKLFEAKAFKSDIS